MSNYTNYYGIDISKDTFDVVSQTNKHLQFSNNQEGFTAFSKLLNYKDLCVMEVTGVYHLGLANFLYSKNFCVSVVNALKIKRFSQMLLKRNKTDKADAKMICKYAQNQEVELYKPKETCLDQAKDYVQLIEQFINMKSDLKRKVKSLITKVADQEIINVVEQQINDLSEKILTLELHVEQLVKVKYQNMITLLSSIPGIGKKTAILLIIETRGFKNFSSSKKLCSFFGLAPTERSSGTSINGSRKISKMGNPLVRKKIYMCSLQASQCNKHCKSLFQRLVNKGKSKKLALIAVANKLIKICFGVVNNNTIYQDDYVGNLIR